MDSSIKTRIKNQIIKFDVTVDASKDGDGTFTLDYERGRYRQDELVGLIRDVVPFFALTEAEIKSIDRSEWNRQSFNRISDANKNSKGDYGELMLYVILSVFYEVPKFVTKARLRSTTKDQIKGFDCAHFTISGSKVTLWLGEAKFHQDISGAIASAYKSLSEHLDDDERIKGELKLLGGEIEINKQLDPDTYNALKEYVSGGKSLDKVQIAVPVLITYDSSCIQKFSGDKDADIESDTFRRRMKQELEKNFESIYKKKWPGAKNIKISFFVLPLACVADLKANIELVERVMRF